MTKDWLKIGWKWTKNYIKALRFDVSEFQLTRGVNGEEIKEQRIGERAKKQKEKRKVNKGLEKEK